MQCLLICSKVETPSRFFFFFKVSSLSSYFTHRDYKFMLSHIVLPYFTFVFNLCHLPTITMWFFLVYLFFHGIHSSQSGGCNFHFYFAFLLFDFAILGCYFLDFSYLNFYFVILFFGLFMSYFKVFYPFSN